MESRKARSNTGREKRRTGEDLGFWVVTGREVEAVAVAAESRCREARAAGTHDGWSGWMMALL